MVEGGQQMDQCCGWIDEQLDSVLRIGELAHRMHRQRFSKEILDGLYCLRVKQEHSHAMGVVNV